MAAGLPLNMNVPIIGQTTVEISDATASAVIRCTCKPGNKAKLIPALAAAFQCDECGRIYAITKIRFDRLAGTVDFQVGQIGQAPAPPSTAQPS